MTKPTIVSQVVICLDTPNAKICKVISAVLGVNTMVCASKLDCVDSTTHSLCRYIGLGKYCQVQPKPQLSLAECIFILNFAQHSLLNRVA